VRDDVRRNFLLSGREANGPARWNWGELRRRIDVAGAGIEKRDGQLFKGQKREGGGLRGNSCRRSTKRKLLMKE